MNQMQQLMIVLGGLALLPFVLKLLRMAHLLPLAVYFFITRLGAPKWAAANTRLCICLFAGAVLYFVLRWAWKIVKKKKERKALEAEVLRTAIPLCTAEDFRRWAEQQ